MMNLNRKPLVGVVSDTQTIDPHVFHTAGDKYLNALAQASGVVPVILPSLLPDVQVTDYLSRLDGIFLTGSYSMAEPSLYGESRIDLPYRYDTRRDALAKALIDAVIASDLPLFGVCRGFQDINVALGGSLHQAVQDVDGLNDHREDKSLSLPEQYAAAHQVDVVSGGLLERIVDRPSMNVNSLHSQGINRLGSGLSVEANAPDGLIEALSIDALSFGLAVQWHPEWKVMENQEQKLIFEAFGDACRARQSK
ncbi:gamma-glutamyl-gamma-aminobutyrate hydrolase family protein [Marinobacter sp. F4216]|uniref:gamma-glutamyl-gamma-aminobutyrate hydrolase family protein n=1 Tax=Marinobacter sp. F4216 TaxID=2874281 RepID=UPI001CBA82D3|nr:gamma-glutamyl-gamma-aminobutyrate hydrolase family protein [Marinobacter sp. F4216]MBZ2168964.1 gamma-glutamyl-gamma-aminobutyrate hydrolase family protein [Marinobacter sp. F4216]